MTRLALLFCLVLAGCGDVRPEAVAGAALTLVNPALGGLAGALIEAAE
jgi:hypothetical protein